jgi:hypothetical protein
MNTFINIKSLALALQNILDTQSDVLDKCLRFSLIKIESVSISQAKPRLVPSSQSVVYTFLLKMLSLVLINKNQYLFVFSIVILSDKLYSNQETHFTTYGSIRHNAWVNGYFSSRCKVGCGGARKRKS